MPVADNVFAYSPVEAALERQKPRSIFDQKDQQKAPKAVEAPKSALDIASATQVPPNIIEAFQEAVGTQVDDPAVSARASENFATQLGQQLQQGKPMREAMSALLGDDSDAIVDRALAIANGGKGAPQQPGDASGGEFEGEGAGSLIKRRGQQFAAGAADAVSGTQEVAGRSQLEGARNMREQAAQRIDNAKQQIEALRSELPNLPSDDERAYVEEQIQQLEAQIRQNQATETMGAETLPETAGFQRGEAIRDATEDAFGAPDERDQSFWGQVARGAGNMTGMGVAGLPTFGAGAAVSGMGMNARSLYEEAIEAGASEDVAEQASKIGMTIGATEMVPLARALKILPPSFRGKITNGVMKRLAHIAKGSGEEAAQEYLATVANNIVAQNLYDPERGWTENATEGALVGAVLGGGAGAIGSMRGGDVDQDTDDGQINPKPAPTAPRNSGPNDEPVPGAEPPAPAPEPAPNDDLGGDTLPEFTPDAPDAPDAPAPPAPPSGPLSRAAQRGPAQTLSSGLTEGAQVRVTTPDGIDMSAEFVEETADGLMLKSKSGPLLVSPEQIASGEIAVAPRDPIQEQREEMAAKEAEQAEQAAPMDSSPIFADTGARAGGNASTMQGPVSNSPIRLQKRPFTNLINSRLGGIEPDSEVGSELIHMGITPQTAPGLFRKGGAKDVDNLVAGDWGEYASLVGTDGEYLSRQGVIDAIAREVAGDPVQDQTQRDLQQEKDAREWIAEARERGWEVDDQGTIEIAPESAADFGFVVPTPNTDISTPEERGNYISRVLRDTEAEGGFDLTQQERDEAYQRLDQNGGTVEDVLWSILEREVDEDTNGSATDESAYPDPPFSEQEFARASEQQDAAESASDTGEPESQPGTEGRGDAQAEDAGSPGAPDAADGPQVATEATPEGEQSLIPGVAPVTDSDRAQAGAQRPMRGRDDAPPEGGLFDDGARAQDDMFASPRARSEGGATSTRTTRDGYTVERSAEKTTVRTPDGRAIFAGAPDVADGKADQAIRKHRKKTKDEAAQKDTTSSEVEAAAAETETNPSDGQKEAENYKTGKLQWNGLTLSIENPKGSVRSKTGPNGKEWSVTMPAHYGRILRTEGADGDHVDFYLGDVPDSDYVVIINQVDPETQKFDEHKLILGTTARGAALGIYRKGFSDGSGDRRIGSFTETNVASLKAWLAPDVIKKPSEPITMPFARDAAKPKNPSVSVEKSEPEQEPAPVEDANKKPGRAAASDDAGTADTSGKGEVGASSGAVDGERLLSKAEKRLTDALRKAWVDRENLPDGDDDASVQSFQEATQKVRAARQALESEVGADRASKALEQIEQEYFKGVADQRSTTTDVVSQDPSESEPQRSERLDDFGEKLGGARKDAAEAGAPRKEQPKKATDQPAWRRRYEVNEVVKDARTPANVGKFKITDTRSKYGRVAGSSFRDLVFDTREEAEAAIPGIEARRNHTIRSYGDGSFAIVRKVSDRKRPAVKGGFESREAATEYLAKNPEEIIETKLRVDDSIHPALEDAIREGEQRRAGNRNVGAQDFGDIFGFRGVEFGNWNNTAERQHILNQAFDAFLDLSEITKIPPKAVSLNGELGLGFGSRGKGLTGARAHYERNYGVINLTKIKGAGALAHEWMHAVDHYIARLDGSAAVRKSDAKEGDPIFDAKTAERDYASHGFLHRSGAREELKEAMKGLMQTIMKRDMAYQEDTSTREKVSRRHGERLDTVLNQIKAELEKEARYGRKKAPATPEQMERANAAIERIKAGDLGKMADAPTKSRFRTFSFHEPVMELAEVFKEVRGRQAYGERQGRTHGHAVDIEAAILQKQKAEQYLDEAKEQKTKWKKVTSEFASHAWAMDQGSKKDYWSTNHELLARAFESFIYDRLKEAGGRNDFLAYEKHNDLPEYRLFGVKPYPEGQERQDMNKAFAHLFDILETETGSDGAVRLYQAPMDVGISNTDGQTLNKDPGGVDRATLRQIMPDLRKRLDRMALTRVQLEHTPEDDGFQAAFEVQRTGEMKILIGATVDAEKSIDHEAIHALRAMNLFTKEEWAALEAEAERSWIKKYDIESRYSKDKSGAPYARWLQVEEAVAEAFADRKLKTKSPILNAFNKMKRFFKMLRATLKNQNVASVGQVFADVEAGRVGARAGAGAPSSQDQRLQASERDTFAADFVSQLAQVDDAFQYPRAASRTLDGVFSEIAPEAAYQGIMSPADITADDPGAERHLFRMPGGKPFYVYRTEDEVWFDVSELEEGQAGNALYAAMGDYARNSGRQFIGDPEGLSEVALRRRTDAMLSSALKHSTTEHLRPHEYQVKGDEKLGVPPLGWREGDHLGNIQSLIDVTVESLAHHVPEFRRARYDFRTATFRSSEGATITDENLREWASKFGRVREARAGVRTLKRDILFNTLARAESGQRPGLLEQVLRQPRKLVGDSLRGVFYQRQPDAEKPAQKESSREPVASLTGKEIKPDDDGMRALRTAGIKWYRDNLVGKKITNRDTGWQIGFTRRGAAKSVNAKGEDLVRLIPALEQVLEQGALISTEPDIYDRPDMKAVHKLAARVMLDGKPKDVVVTVREDSNGRMHYDLSRDMSVGARFAKKSTAGRGDTLPDPALEVSPDTLNVSVAPEPVKRTVVMPDEVRALKGRLRDELKRVGLSGRIKLRVSDGPISADFPGMDALDGYFLDSTIGIASDATGEGGAMGTLRHEIIHALRDPALWGGSHGLFTKAEWQTLVRAARGPRNKHLRDKAKRLYPDLNEAGQIEEVVADMFREWGAKRDTATPAGKVLAKLGDIIQAITKALRLSGADTAADVFGRINSGEVGGRGPDGPGGGGVKASRRDPAFSSVEPVSDSDVKRGRKRLVSNMLSQAMAGGKSGSRTNILALVPGRALFAELGKDIPSAAKYLRLKEKMDTLRNERHGDTDKVAQKWRKIMNKDKPNNVRMMNLMHDSTIAGLDPSEPYKRVSEPRDKDILEQYKPHTKTYKEAKARLDRDQRRRARYDQLKGEFDSLPADFKGMFRTVRDEYRKLATEFEQAIEEQAAKAMTVAVRRAERAHKKEMERITDEGLTGQEKEDAIADADRVLKNSKLTTMLSKQARISQLRRRFESNRIEGPYFPLARFGDLYVTSRDKDGKIVSFSKFEKVTEQQEEAARMRRAGYDVEVGVMSETTQRDMVDPGFVADVEGLLEEISADSMVMDAIWQRWLETLPDMSIRKNRMHRKGTQGFSGDAFRAFGKQMFHGAHQLARLKYSLDMSEALEVAADDARRSADPVRNGLVVREMDRRHEYVMNPQGAAWAQGATSAAFVYYLGATPAAAIVNMTQTTVVGTPILGAFYGKGGIRKAGRELMRAMGDFTTGKGHAADSKRLTDDERAAMAEAYDRGVVDKSQSHDLAGVGETGVEYNATRTMVMEKISWFFHHAERMNREVTFLAAYRMAKAKGMDMESAVQKAGDLTWKTHFDYQNTSRPRLMQNDGMRVALVFRNFQINMLWRLFRDTHQMVSGKSKAERKEAMAQLAGITGSMMFHAGVKGTWGYALITTLLGTFFAGGSDDVEEAMETALLNYLPKDAAGMIMNGAPGHLTGIDLTSRIGMPELWFRKPWRELEGEDEYNYWVQQLLGAVPGIAENAWRGTSMISDGKWWRGVETMSPKFIRDMMRTGRYWKDGAETYRGDPIIDKFSSNELLAQFIGFSPARLSERYDLNSRMKNREQRIMNERKDILASVRKSRREGDGMTVDIVDRIAAFNREHPTYPITLQTLKRSIRGSMRASQRNNQGVQINPRLDYEIRSTTRDPIYE